MGQYPESHSSNRVHPLFSSSTLHDHPGDADLTTAFSKFVPTLSSSFVSSTKWKEGESWKQKEERSAAQGGSGGCDSRESDEEGEGAGAITAVPDAEKGYYPREFRQVCGGGTRIFSPHSTVSPPPHSSSFLPLGVRLPSSRTVEEKENPSNNDRNNNQRVMRNKNDPHDERKETECASFSSSYCGDYCSSQLDQAYEDNHKDEVHNSAGDEGENYCTLFLKSSTASSPSSLLSLGGGGGEFFFSHGKEACLPPSPPPPTVAADLSNLFLRKGEAEYNVTRNTVKGTDEEDADGWGSFLEEFLPKTSFSFSLSSSAYLHFPSIPRALGSSFFSSFSFSSLLLFSPLREKEEEEQKKLLIEYVNDSMGCCLVCFWQRLEHLQQSLLPPSSASPALQESRTARRRSEAKRGSDEDEDDPRFCKGRRIWKGSLSDINHCDHNHPDSTYSRARRKNSPLPSHSCSSWGTLPRLDIITAVLDLEKLCMLVKNSLLLPLWDRLRQLQKASSAAVVAAPAEGGRKGRRVHTKNAQFETRRRESPDEMVFEEEGGQEETRNFSSYFSPSFLRRWRECVGILHWYDRATTQVENILVAIAFSACGIIPDDFLRGDQDEREKEEERKSEENHNTREEEAKGWTRRRKGNNKTKKKGKEKEGEEEEKEVFRDRSSGSESDSPLSSQWRHHHHRRHHKLELWKRRHRHTEPPTTITTTRTTSAATQNLLHHHHRLRHRQEAKHKRHSHPSFSHSSSLYIEASRRHREKEGCGRRRADDEKKKKGCRSEEIGRNRGRDTETKLFSSFPFSSLPSPPPPEEEEVLEGPRVSTFRFIMRNIPTPTNIAPTLTHTTTTTSSTFTTTRCFSTNMNNNVPFEMRDGATTVRAAASPSPMMMPMRIREEEEEGEKRKKQDETKKNSSTIFPVNVIPQSSLPSKLPIHHHHQPPTRSAAAAPALAFSSSLNTISCLRSPSPYSSTTSTTTSSSSISSRSSCRSRQTRGRRRWKRADERRRWKGSKGKSSNGKGRRGREDELYSSSSSSSSSSPHHRHHLPSPPTSRKTHWMKKEQDDWRRKKKEEKEEKRRRQKKEEEDGGLPSSSSLPTSSSSSWKEGGKNAYFLEWWRRWEEAVECWTLWMFLLFDQRDACRQLSAKFISSMSIMKMESKKKMKSEEEEQESREDDDDEEEEEGEETSQFSIWGEKASSLAGPTRRPWRNPDSHSHSGMKSVRAPFPPLAPSFFLPFFSSLSSSASSCRGGAAAFTVTSAWAFIQHFCSDVSWEVYYVDAYYHAHSTGRASWTERLEKERKPSNDGGEKEKEEAEEEGQEAGIQMDKRRRRGGGMYSSEEKEEKDALWKSKWRRKAEIESSALFQRYQAIRSTFSKISSLPPSFPTTTKDANNLISTFSPPFPAAAGGGSGDNNASTGPLLPLAPPSSPPPSPPPSASTSTSLESLENNSHPPFHVHEEKEGNDRRWTRKEKEDEDERRGRKWKRNERKKRRRVDHDRYLTSSSRSCGSSNSSSTYSSSRKSEEIEEETEEADEMCSSTFSPNRRMKEKVKNSCAALCCRDNSHNQNKKREEKRKNRRRGLLHSSTLHSLHPHRHDSPSPRRTAHREPSPTSMKHQMKWRKEREKEWGEVKKSSSSSLPTTPTTRMVEEEGRRIKSEQQMELWEEWESSFLRSHSFSSSFSCNHHHRRCTQKLHYVGGILRYASSLRSARLSFHCASSALFFPLPFPSSFFSFSGDGDDPLRRPEGFWAREEDFKNPNRTGVDAGGGYESSIPLLLLLVDLFFLLLECQSFLPSSSPSYIYADATDDEEVTKRKEKETDNAGGGGGHPHLPSFPSLDGLHSSNPNNTNSNYHNNEKRSSKQEENWGGVSLACVLQLIYDVLSTILKSSARPRLTTRTKGGCVSGSGLRKRSNKNEKNKIFATNTSFSSSCMKKEGTLVLCRLLRSHSPLSSSMRFFSSTLSGGGITTATTSNHHTSRSTSRCFPSSVPEEGRIHEKNRREEEGVREMIASAAASSFLPSCLSFSSIWNTHSSSSSSTLGFALLQGLLKVLLWFLSPSSCSSPPPPFLITSTSPFLFHYAFKVFRLLFGIEENDEDGKDDEKKEEEVMTAGGGGGVDEDMEDAENDHKRRSIRKRKSRWRWRKKKKEEEEDERVKRSGLDNEENKDFYSSISTLSSFPPSTLLLYTALSLLSRPISHFGLTKDNSSCSSSSLPLSSLNPLPSLNTSFSPLQPYPTGTTTAIPHSLLSPPPHDENEDPRGATIVFLAQSLDILSQLFSHSLVTDTLLPFLRYAMGRTGTISSLSSSLPSCNEFQSSCSTLIVNERSIVKTSPTSSFVWTCDGWKMVTRTRDRGGGGKENVWNTLQHQNKSEHKINTEVVAPEKKLMRGVCAPALHEQAWSVLELVFRLVTFSEDVLRFIAQGAREGWEREEKKRTKGKKKDKKTNNRFKREDERRKHRRRRTCSMGSTPSSSSLSTTTTTPSPTTTAMTVPSAVFPSFPLWRKRKREHEDNTEEKEEEEEFMFIIQKEEDEEDEGGGDGDDCDKNRMEKKRKKRAGDAGGGGVVESLCKEKKVFSPPWGVPMFSSPEEGERNLLGASGKPAMWGRKDATPPAHPRDTRTIMEREETRRRMATHSSTTATATAAPPYLPFQKEEKQQERTAEENSFSDFSSSFFPPPLHLSYYRSCLVTCIAGVEDSTQPVVEALVHHLYEQLRQVSENGGNSSEEEKDEKGEGRGGSGGVLPPSASVFSSSSSRQVALHAFMSYLMRILNAIAGMKVWGRMIMENHRHQHHRVCSAPTRGEKSDPHLLLLPLHTSTKNVLQVDEDDKEDEDSSFSSSTTFSSSFPTSPSLSSSSSSSLLLLSSSSSSSGGGTKTFGGGGMCRRPSSLPLTILLDLNLLLYLKAPQFPPTMQRSRRLLLLLPPSRPPEYSPLPLFRSSSSSWEYWCRIFTGMYFREQFRHQLVVERENEEEEDERRRNQQQERNSRYFSASIHENSWKKGEPLNPPLSSRATITAMRKTPPYYYYYDYYYYYPSSCGGRRGGGTVAALNTLLYFILDGLPIWKAHLHPFFQLVQHHQEEQKLKTEREGERRRQKRREADKKKRWRNNIFSNPEPEDEEEEKAIEERDAFPNRYTTITTASSYAYSYSSGASFFSSLEQLFSSFSSDGLMHSSLFPSLQLMSFLVQEAVHHCFTSHVKGKKNQQSPRLQEEEQEHKGEGEERERWQVLEENTTNTTSTASSLSWLLSYALSLSHDSVTSSETMPTKRRNLSHGTRHPFQKNHVYSLAAPSSPLPTSSPPPHYHYYYCNTTPTSSKVRTEEEAEDEEAWGGILITVRKEKSVMDDYAVLLLLQTLETFVTQHCCTDLLWMMKMRMNSRYIANSKKKKHQTREEEEEEELFLNRKDQLKRQGRKDQEKNMKKKGKEEETLRRTRWGGDADDEEEDENMIRIQERGAATSPYHYHEKNEDSMRNNDLFSNASSLSSLSFSSSFPRPHLLPKTTLCYEYFREFCRSDASFFFCSSSFSSFYPHQIHPFSFSAAPPPHSSSSFFRMRNRNGSSSNKRKCVPLPPPIWCISPRVHAQRDFPSSYHACIGRGVAVMEEEDEEEDATSSFSPSSSLLCLLLLWWCDVLLSPLMAEVWEWRRRRPQDDGGGRGEELYSVKHCSSSSSSPPTVTASRTFSSSSHHQCDFLLCLAAGLLKEFFYAYANSFALWWKDQDPKWRRRVNPLKHRWNPSPPHHHRHHGRQHDGRNYFSHYPHHYPSLSPDDSATTATTDDFWTPLFCGASWLSFFPASSSGPSCVHANGLRFHLSPRHRYSHDWGEIEKKTNTITKKKKKKIKTNKKGKHHLHRKKLKSYVVGQMECCTALLHLAASLLTLGEEVLWVAMEDPAEIKIKMEMEEENEKEDPQNYYRHNRSDSLTSCCLVNESGAINTTTRRRRLEKDKEEDEKYGGRRGGEGRDDSGRSRSETINATGMRQRKMGIEEEEEEEERNSETLWKEQQQPLPQYRSNDADNRYRMFRAFKSLLLCENPFSSSSSPWDDDVAVVASSSPTFTGVINWLLSWSRDLFLFFEHDLKKKTRKRNSKDVNEDSGKACDRMTDLLEARAVLLMSFWRSMLRKHPLALEMDEHEVQVENTTRRRKEDRLFGIFSSSSSSSLFSGSTFVFSPLLLRWMTFCRHLGDLWNIVFFFPSEKGNATTTRGKKPKFHGILQHTKEEEEVDKKTMKNFMRIRKGEKAGEEEKETMEQKEQWSNEHHHHHHHHHPHHTTPNNGGEKEEESEDKSLTRSSSPFSSSSFLSSSSSLTLSASSSSLSCSVSFSDRGVPAKTHQGKRKRRRGNERSDGKTVSRGPSPHRSFHKGKYHETREEESPQNKNVMMKEADGMSFASAAAQRGLLTFTWVREMLSSFLPFSSSPSSSSSRSFLFLMYQMRLSSAKVCEWIYLVLHCLALLPPLPYVSHRLEKPPPPTTKGKGKEKRRKASQHERKRMCRGRSSIMKRMRGRKDAKGEGGKGKSAVTTTSLEEREENKGIHEGFTWCRAMVYCCWSYAVFCEVEEQEQQDEYYSSLSPTAAPQRHDEEESETFYLASRRTEEERDWAWNQFHPNRKSRRKDSIRRDIQEEEEDDGGPRGKKNEEAERKRRRFSAPNRVSSSAGCGDGAPTPPSMCHSNTTPTTADGKAKQKQRRSTPPPTRSLFLPFLPSRSELIAAGMRIKRNRIHMKESNFNPHHMGNIDEEEEAEKEVDRTIRQGEKWLSQLLQLSCLSILMNTATTTMMKKESPKCTSAMSGVPHREVGQNEHRKGREEGKTRRTRPPSSPLVAHSVEQDHSDEEEEGIAPAAVLDDDGEDAVSMSSASNYSLEYDEEEVEEPPPPPPPDGFYPASSLSSSCSPSPSSPGSSPISSFTSFLVMIKKESVHLVRWWNKLSYFVAGTSCSTFLFPPSSHFWRKEDDDEEEEEDDLVVTKGPRGKEEFSCSAPDHGQPQKQKEKKDENIKKQDFCPRGSTRDVASWEWRRRREGGVGGRGGLVSMEELLLGFIFAGDKTRRGMEEDKKKEKQPRKTEEEENWTGTWSTHLHFLLVWAPAPLYCRPSPSPLPSPPSSSFSSSSPSSSSFLFHQLSNYVEEHAHSSSSFLSPPHLTQSTPPLSSLSTNVSSFSFFFFEDLWKKMIHAEMVEEEEEEEEASRAAAVISTTTPSSSTNNPHETFSFCSFTSPFSLPLPPPPSPLPYKTFTAHCRSTEILLRRFPSILLKLSSFFLMLSSSSSSCSSSPLPLPMWWRQWIEIWWSHFIWTEEWWWRCTEETAGRTTPAVGASGKQRSRGGQPHRSGSSFTHERKSPAASASPSSFSFSSTGCCDDLHLFPPRLPSLGSPRRGIRRQSTTSPRSTTTATTVPAATTGVLASSPSTEASSSSSFSLLSSVSSLTEVEVEEWSHNNNHSHRKDEEARFATWKVQGTPSDAGGVVEKQKHEKKRQILSHEEYSSSLFPISPVPPPPPPPPSSYYYGHSDSSSCCSAFSSPVSRVTSSENRSNGDAQTRKNKQRTSTASLMTMNRRSSNARGSSNRSTSAVGRRRKQEQRLDSSLPSSSSSFSSFSTFLSNPSADDDEGEEEEEDDCCCSYDSTTTNTHHTLLLAAARSAQGVQHLLLMWWWRWVEQTNRSLLLSSPSSVAEGFPLGLTSRYSLDANKKVFSFSSSCDDAHDSPPLDNDKNTRENNAFRSKIEGGWRSDHHSSTATTTANHHNHNSHNNHNNGVPPNVFPWYYWHALLQQTLTPNIPMMKTSSSSSCLCCPLHYYEGNDLCERERRSPLPFTPTTSAIPILFSAAQWLSSKKTKTTEMFNRAKKKESKMRKGGGRREEGTSLFFPHYNDADVVGVGRRSRGEDEIHHPTRGGSAPSPSSSFFSSFSSASFGGGGDLLSRYLLSGAVLQTLLVKHFLGFASLPHSFTFFSSCASSSRKSSPPLPPPHYDYPHLESPSTTTSTVFASWWEKWILAEVLTFFPLPVKTPTAAPPFASAASPSSFCVSCPAYASTSFVHLHLWWWISMLGEEEEEKKEAETKKKGGTEVDPVLRMTTVSDSFATSSSSCCHRPHQFSYYYHRLEMTLQSELYMLKSHVLPRILSRSPRSHSSPLSSSSVLETNNDKTMEVEGSEERPRGAFHQRKSPQVERRRWSSTEKEVTISDRIGYVDGGKDRGLSSSSCDHHLHQFHTFHDAALFEEEEGENRRRCWREMIYRVLLLRTSLQFLHMMMTMAAAAPKQVNAPQQGGSQKLFGVVEVRDDDEDTQKRRKEEDDQEAQNWISCFSPSLVCRVGETMSFLHQVYQLAVLRRGRRHGHLYRSPFCLSRSAESRGPSSHLIPWEEESDDDDSTSLSSSSASCNEEEEENYYYWNHLAEELGSFLMEEIWQNNHPQKEDEEAEVVKVGMKRHPSPTRRTAAGAWIKKGRGGIGGGSVWRCFPMMSAVYRTWCLPWDLEGILWKMRMKKKKREVTWGEGRRRGGGGKEFALFPSSTFPTVYSTLCGDGSFSSVRDGFDLWLRAKHLWMPHRGASPFFFFHFRNHHYDDDDSHENRWSSVIDGSRSGWSLWRCWWWWCDASSSSSSLSLPFSFSKKESFATNRSRSSCTASSSGREGERESLLSPQTSLSSALFLSAGGTNNDAEEFQFKVFSVFLQEILFLLPPPPSSSSCSLLRERKETMMKRRRREGEEEDTKDEHEEEEKKGKNENGAFWEKENSSVIQECSSRRRSEDDDLSAKTHEREGDDDDEGWAAPFVLHGRRDVQEIQKYDDDGDDDDDDDDGDFSCLDPHPHRLGSASAASAEEIESIFSSFYKWDRACFLGAALYHLTGEMGNLWNAPPPPDDDNGGEGGCRWGYRTHYREVSQQEQPQHSQYRDYPHFHFKKRILRYQRAYLMLFQVTRFQLKILLDRTEEEGKVSTFSGGSSGINKGEKSIPWQSVEEEEEVSPRLRDHNSNNLPPPPLPSPPPFSLSPSLFMKWVREQGERWCRETLVGWGLAALLSLHFLFCSPSSLPFLLLTSPSLMRKKRENQTVPTPFSTTAGRKRRRGEMVRNGGERRKEKEGEEFRRRTAPPPLPTTTGGREGRSCLSGEMDFFFKCLLPPASLTQLIQNFFLYFSSFSCSSSTAAAFTRSKGEDATNVMGTKRDEKHFRCFSTGRPLQHGGDGVDDGGGAKGAQRQEEEEEEEVKIRAKHREGGNTSVIDWWYAQVGVMAEETARQQQQQQAPQEHTPWHCLSSAPAFASLFTREKTYSAYTSRKGTESVEASRFPPEIHERMMALHDQRTQALRHLQQVLSLVVVPSSSSSSPPSPLEERKKKKIKKTQ